MRVAICVLIATACVLADDSEKRRSNLPYVADAVGNTLPPPSNVPATVGSPVNLLTPDRYEFYTFDESGELVKRLMTLEEIQAIVAAGEETEGLVTFANENQPTIAFNFSQPPYTKVHNVVTNVQNVLKAQMEAHKNKPHTQPTLDTPDVSDSWSLILPSIFGNTGVDFTPDKISGPFSTPETETIELDRPEDDNSLSKEGSNQIFSSSTTAVDEEQKLNSITEKIPLRPVEPNTNPTSTTTTTLKPSTTSTTTTTTPKPQPTTAKTTKIPLYAKTTTTKSTTAKPTTNKPTTLKSHSTTSTTARPITTSTTIKTTITPLPTTTTSRPRTTFATSKPRTTTAVKTTTKANVKTTTKVTTVRPNVSTPKPLTTTPTDNDGNYTRVQLQTIANTISTTEKHLVQYDKLSTFIPVSTAAYVTERSTQKPVTSTKPTEVFVSTTKRSVPSTTKSPTTFEISSTTAANNLPITTYKPSISTTTIKTTTTEFDSDKQNATTMTTQSVSPSTTVASTEFVTVENDNHLTGNKLTELKDTNNDVKDIDQDINLFDVAQSFSQIASDLGGNFAPLPTTSNLLETTKLTDTNLESKENVEIDIPADTENATEMHTTNSDSDSFVKISTLDPHSQDEDKANDVKEINSNENKLNVEATQMNKTTSSLPASTTIDPVLSESMEDLLSQVVNQAPTMINPENSSTKVNQIATTEKNLEFTTEKDANDTVTNSFDKENNMKIQDFTSESKNVTNAIVSNIEKTENKTSKPTIISDHESIKNEDNSVNKTDNNQNFVQISISDNKDKSGIKSIPSTTTSKPQNVEDLKTVVDAHDQSTQKPVKNQVEEQITSKLPNLKENLESIVTTELYENKDKDIAHNIKKTEITLSQSSNSKIVTIDNNESNPKKDKTPEAFPKIEEFKKKFQKVNIDDKELANDRNNSWKLISTVSPPKADMAKDKVKIDGQETDKVVVLEFSKENQGLEVTTKDVGDDIAQFTELCNELAFRYWNVMIENIEKKRSFVLSPYSITSMLAMMFMGARGATSGEMNEILKLDDMVTFNPHFTLKNISDSIETNPDSGVVVSAFVRELFSDKNKGKILTFYKERAQHFYNGHVEEINFKLISDIIRRRTNLLVKRYTWGRIVEYMKANTITMQPPLAAFSTNIFQTDCTGSSVEGRDGEMYFVVSPNVRQRRLVPVPAVVYRNGFLAGYDPVLDATAAALGNTNSVISTLFLMPGQQGNVVHADDLEALEKRLLDSNPTTPAWNRLLRTLLPRMGLELQIPRFSHKSIFNVSSTLKKMGLKDIFDAEHADLGGLNGPSKDLYLSDMVQSTMFVTCGEGAIGEQHHIEEYPENLGGPQRRRTSRWVTGWDEPRDYQRAFHDPHDVGDAMHLPLHLRPRQARVPARTAQPARLKFDRPFLYFVRHNPTGMILYVGRYNPRLLP